MDNSFVTKHKEPVPFDRFKRLFKSTADCYNHLNIMQGPGGQSSPSDSAPVVARSGNGDLTWYPVRKLTPYNKMDAIRRAMYGWHIPVKCYVTLNRKRITAKRVTLYKVISNPPGGDVSVNNIVVHLIEGNYNENVES